MSEQLNRQLVLGPWPVVQPAFRDFVHTAEEFTREIHSRGFAKTGIEAKAMSVGGAARNWLLPLNPQTKKGV
jgi:hypothetical protein